MQALLYYQLTSFPVVLSLFSLNVPCVSLVLVPLFVPVFDHQYSLGPASLSSDKVCVGFPHFIATAFIFDRGIASLITNLRQFRSLSLLVMHESQMSKGMYCN